MGIALDDVPNDPPRTILNADALQLQGTFLMRNNRCVAIREHAMSMRLIDKLTPEEIKEFKECGVVAFKTKAEQDDWLNCK